MTKQTNQKQNKIENNYGIIGTKMMNENSNRNSMNNLLSKINRKNKQLNKIFKWGRCKTYGLSLVHFRMNQLFFLFGTNIFCVVIGTRTNTSYCRKKTTKQPNEKNNNNKMELCEKKHFVLV